MSVSRREFLSVVGAAGAASSLPWITARGSESRLGGTPARASHLWRGPGDLIRLDSNENPRGPAPAALSALQQTFDLTGRYPDAAEESLRAAIAAHHGVGVESVLLGCGSTEILKIATEAFTSPTRPLVTAAPTFEVPTRTAQRMGTPIRAIPVDASLRLDLDAMLEQSSGAGLVFLCNPNNPTGTLHGLDTVSRFVRDVQSRAPDAYTLIDEAYFEFADAPAYRTAIPLALASPRVLVSRTFSKVHGMAGLRAGYAIAHPETISRLLPFRLESGISVLAGAAAITSLGLSAHVRRQVALNLEARTFAMDAMRSLGYRVVPSQTNFFMADIQRDPKAFQVAMRARGVAIGRAFPPLSTYTRISIGTLDEMQRAMTVAADVLRNS
ncbi:MAG: aminotransferase class I/II-fold pyridoxal phosphate-dependent enzyme [Gemmatimonadaceae bacterium]